MTLDFTPGDLVYAVTPHQNGALAPKQAADPTPAPAPPPMAPPVGTLVPVEV